MQPNPIVQLSDGKRYIDPTTDFSFKHFFGKEPHKDLLIKFLNGLLKGQKVIADLEYNNVERKGVSRRHRKTIFDLYCTSSNGEKFIIEMQKAEQDYFKDRSLFYMASLIQEYGASVNSGWNYKLPEIYFVAILNFSFPESQAGKYIHNVRLIEEDTCERFYHKLGFIYVEVPKFVKQEEELETDQDYWLYLLKNLRSFNEIPLTLRNKEEFKKFFKIAEVSNLSPEDMNAYQQSLKIKRDNYSVLETAINKAEANGERKNALKVALEMKNAGEPVSKIVKFTKLTIKEIEAL